MQRNGKRLINDSAVFTAQCTKTTHRPTHRRHQSRKGRTVLFLLKVGGGTPWGTCPLSRRESPLVPQNCGRLYIPETPEEFRLSREPFTPILSERYRLSLRFYSQSGALYSRASVHGIYSLSRKATEMLSCWVLYVLVFTAFGNIEGALSHSVPTC